MNTHPEPGLPSERAVTERLADAVATGLLPPLHTCGACGQEYITAHDCRGRRGDGEPNPCPVCWAPNDTLPELKEHMQVVHGLEDEQVGGRRRLVKRRTTVESTPTDAEWMDNMRGRPETITEEAQRLVLGDRQDDYGHPADDFARTALIWSAIIGTEVTALQVALCMVGVKLSREVNRPKRDNRVDAIGYMLTAQLIHQRAEQ